MNNHLSLGTKARTQQEHLFDNDIPLSQERRLENAIDEVTREGSTKLIDDRIADPSTEFSKFVQMALDGMSTHDMGEALKSWVNRLVEQVARERT